MSNEELITIDGYDYKKVREGYVDCYKCSLNIKSKILGQVIQECEKDEAKRDFYFLRADMADFSNREEKEDHVEAKREVNKEVLAKIREIFSNDKIPQQNRCEEIEVRSDTDKLVNAIKSLEITISVCTDKVIKTIQK